MDVSELLKSEEYYSDQIVHEYTQQSRTAQSRPIEDFLPKWVLSDLEFEELYTHQYNALQELEDGNNVCVTTETASGKTLVYALQILRNKIENPNSTALLLYPTKALSRDQKRELESIYSSVDIEIDIGVYDGDVNSEEKRVIRNESDVIITNFQGMNYYLPHHEKWVDFFEECELVVVDEAHMYTGVMGMHVAWILRRIQRVIDHEYDNNPQLVLTSATIGNPSEHAYNLTGQNHVVIDEDGSPRGERNILFWNPPKYGDGSRRSSHTSTSEILSTLVSNDIQTLTFTTSRKLTELLLNWTTENLDSKYTLESYNAGHTKEERRSVEQKLKDESLDGIISTNALEVGIDIGSVDATLLDTYPGSRTSFWQQIGRSGRGTRDAFSILVAENSGIDQYIMNNPEYLFEESVENAVVDLQNNNVLQKHLVVAANESPLCEEDMKYYPEQITDAISDLVEMGLLDGSWGDSFYYTGDDFRPESDINLYATSETQFDVLIEDEGKSLPQIDKSRAFREFHEGAIHMHKGEQYKVTSFDLENKEVILQESDVDYYTEAARDVTVSAVKSKERIDIGYGMTVCFGKAKIEEAYDSYSKIYHDDDKGRVTGLSTGIDDTVSMETESLWVEFNSESASHIDGEILASLHGAEHALIKMAPVVITADSNDLGGVSFREWNGNPTLFIYDGVEGGVGFTESLFEQFPDIVRRTRNHIHECDCEDGCPACILDSNCGDNNEPISKHGAVSTLHMILQTINENI